VIRVKMVMVNAEKIIVLDIDKVEPSYLWGRWECGMAAIANEYGLNKHEGSKIRNGNDS
jgi:hypothetical protein